MRDCVLVYIHGEMVTLTGHGLITLAHLQLQNPSFQQFWETLQCEYVVEGQAGELSQAIQQGHMMVVSDSSFQLGAGAAAWTIESITAAH